MKSSKCRLLIVDSNKCYASIVKEQLASSIVDSTVDVAVNIWELRRKLASHAYRFIIADVAASADEREMTKELAKANTPVFYWSAEKDDACDKPSELSEIKKVVEKISISAV